MTQVTVLTGRDRRRAWSLDDRHRILTAACAPGAVIADIARQFDIASSMIYKWRRQARGANRPGAFAPAVVMSTLPHGRHYSRRLQHWRQLRLSFQPGYG